MDDAGELSKRRHERLNEKDGNDDADDQELTGEQRQEEAKKTTDAKQKLNDQQVKGGTGKRGREKNQKESNAEESNAEGTTVKLGTRSGEKGKKAVKEPKAPKEEPRKKDLKKGTETKTAAKSSASGEKEPQEEVVKPTVKRDKLESRKPDNKQGRGDSGLDDKGLEGWKLEIGPELPSKSNRSMSSGEVVSFENDEQPVGGAGKVGRAIAIGKRDRGRAVKAPGPGDGTPMVGGTLESTGEEAGAAKVDHVEDEGLDHGNGTPSGKGKRSAKRKTARGKGIPSRPKAKGDDEDEELSPAQGDVPLDIKSLASPQDRALLLEAQRFLASGSRSKKRTARYVQ